MISRNLQPSKIKAFWFLFIKIPHFSLPKTLDKSLKFCGEADWIYFILSTGGRFLCYLLILAVMLTTKTLLLLRTSAERSNKREKLDFKLEDGRHRSTKMWYCRLYHILMLQHLDAWDLPSEVTPRESWFWM